MALTSTALKNIALYKKKIVDGNTLIESLKTKIKSYTASISDNTDKMAMYHKKIITKRKYKIDYDKLFEDCNKKLRADLRTVTSDLKKIDSASKEISVYEEKIKSFKKEKSKLN